MPARSPLTAVLITLNAAMQLEACLRSLAFCDEIVIVDSGSSDSTLDIAAQYGAKVIGSEWLGFGPQKQFAVTQAKNDWVLCIDADERVSEELAKNIAATLAAPELRVYKFARRNRFMGRYLRHGEGYPDWSLRLFHRGDARWSDDAVHEKVLTDIPVGTLRGDLLHDSAESLDHYLAKQNRYTTLAAQEALARGKRASASKLLLSPLLRFIKFYFLRRGFLDGLPGLVHILIGCQNSFAKYAKMLAIQANSAKSPP
ncbi:Lipopolysaccharide core biosynthesis glycosyltransferase KdtX [Georgfuchsia toluolica]|uniref:Lipopolysaccharide core biosynthesis glycosyltransferase KdtX n=1 Tax=Georgfuchsia toluolica TaxID=424218 RepID=A0A916J5P4_9PROT|nr:glycosyltransferase family 2 protein [Georgfuchsia toluolica]CAG4884699.1 Lipopolysaccharide core biosynthesis glycosyltransferase KdtX [Georgfuchsia toluolica]